VIVANKQNIKHFYAVYQVGVNLRKVGSNSNRPITNLMRNIPVAAMINGQIEMKTGSPGKLPPKRQEIPSINT
jgi:hypothetical protein